MVSEEHIDYGEPVGRGFFENFLLAIIDAHPQPGTGKLSKTELQNRRDERLRTAREALLGQPNPEGRPKTSDLAALRWMGQEHYNDLARVSMAEFKGERPPKVRSVRQLSITAAKCFGMPDNTFERLRDKFGRQKQKWLDVAKYHDDVPETLEACQLDSICKILAKHGVEMQFRGKTK